MFNSLKYVHNYVLDYSDIYYRDTHGPQRTNWNDSNLLTVFYEPLCSVL